MVVSVVFPARPGVFPPTIGGVAFGLTLMGSKGTFFGCGSCQSGRKVFDNDTRLTALVADRIGGVVASHTASGKENADCKNHNAKGNDSFHDLFSFS